MVPSVPLLQCGLSGLAAYFDVRLGDGGHHKPVAAGAGGLGYLLNKGDEIVERAGRQAAHAIDARGIGHEFVHEDEAGAAGIEEVLEGFGTGGYPFIPKAGATNIAPALAFRAGYQRFMKRERMSSLSLMRSPF